MKKYFLLTVFIASIRTVCFTQIPIIISGPDTPAMHPKETPFYGLLQGHDLKKKSFHFIYKDHRKAFKKLSCSDTRVMHNSGFEGAVGMTLVPKYFDNDLTDLSNGIVDTTIGKPVTVTLEMLGPWITSFIEYTGHGLCQIKIEYPGFERTYCVDLPDDNPNSPLSSYKVTTVEIVKEVMTSAAAREVVEKIISDFEKDL